MQVALPVELDCERIVSLLKRRGMTFVNPIASTTLRNHSTGDRPTTASTMLSRMIEPSRKVIQHYRPPGLPMHGESPRFARDIQQAPREMVIDRPTTREMYRGTFSLGSSSEEPGQTIDSGLNSSMTKATSNSTILPRSTTLSQRECAAFTMCSDRQSSMNPADQLGPSANSHIQLSKLWSPAPLEAQTQPRSLAAFFSTASQDLTRSSSTPPASAAVQQPKHILSTGRIADNASSSRQTSSRGGRRKRKVDTDNPASTVDEIVDDTTSSMPPPTARPRSGISRSSPKDMEEVLHGKRPRKGRKTSASGAAIANTTGPTETVQSQQTAQTVMELSSQDLTYVFDQPGLDAYSRLNTNERNSILQQFITSMLGNEAFARLCEDMSTCWQRLMLDLTTSDSS